MRIGEYCAIFVLLLVVLQVNAEYPGNMGMYWGFSIGDRFYFTMNYTGEYDDLIDQEGRIRVDRFCEPVDYGGTLYHFGLMNDDITMYQYYNERYWVMPDAFFMFSLLYCHVFPDGTVVCGGGAILTPFAFPLGNYTCLAHLILDMYSPDSIIFLESEDYWGFEVTGNRFFNNTSIYPNWNVTMHAHFDYSKTDGFLAHYHGLTTYIDSGDIFQEASLDRTGLEPQSMTPVTYIFDTIPDSSSSNTTSTVPITVFSDRNPGPPVSNTSLPLYYDGPLILGMYMTAGVAWVIAIVFIIYDKKKRMSPIN